MKISLKPSTRLKLVVLITLGLGIFLRFYKLDSWPPSLYWEEAALGYDAFSIALTGQDHHGHSWPLAAFESFGDWKPSGYFYALVPFVKVLGLNVWSTRLPSALSGVMIFVGIGSLVYLLAKLQKKPHASTLGLIAMSLAAISPWAIIFSRGAWEVNLATCLILWGVVLFFKFLLSQDYRLAWLLSSVTSLVLSMYTYHAARIVAPLLGFGLVILWFLEERGRVQKKDFYKKIVLAGTTAIVLLLPIFQSLQNPLSQQRFKQTSLFYNLDVIQESNARKAVESNSFASRLLYHRYLLFGREIIQNYGSYLTLDFLFLTGDSNPRHSIQYLGHLYPVDVIFLLIGLFFFFKDWNRYRGFLLFWMLVGILPAAISKTNPHALRILPTLPVWICILTLGVKESFFMCKNQLTKIKISLKSVASVFSSLLILLYLGQLVVYGRYYTQIYPKVYASEWQYGYQQMIEAINHQINQGPETKIFITREQGRPAMYYWFFSQTDPKLVQKASPTARKDQGEFLEYQNISFIDELNQVSAPSLIASSPSFRSQIESRFTTRSISEIYYPDQSLVWQVYYVN